MNARARPTLLGEESQLTKSLLGYIFNSPSLQTLPDFPHLHLLHVMVW